MRQAEWAVIKGERVPLPASFVAAKLGRLGTDQPRSGGRGNLAPENRLLLAARRVRGETEGASAFSRIAVHATQTVHRRVRAIRHMKKGYHTADRPERSGRVGALRAKVGRRRLSTAHLGLH